MPATGNRDHQRSQQRAAVNAGGSNGIGYELAEHLAQIEVVEEESESDETTR